MDAGDDEGDGVSNCSITSGRDAERVDVVFLG